jgi:hypothetical protein
MLRFSTFLLLFCLSSCGLRTALNIDKYSQSEQMARSSFVEEIPFTFVKGEVIVEVEIDGKKEKFMFDTGASTYIDAKLAKRLTYKKMGKVRTKDVNGKWKYPTLVRLDKITVSNTPFTKILAEINNFDNFNKASGLDLAGILGSNMMNKGVWRIDYGKSTLTFSDTRDSLAVLPNSQKIEFTMVGRGTPVIRIAIDNEFFGKAYLDTGNKGGFDFPMSKLPPNMPFKVQNRKVFAMFSSRTDTTKIVTVKNVTLGDDFSLPNAEFTFSKGLILSLIGNEFLKNYIVTIDWRYNELFFTPILKN